MQSHSPDVLTPNPTVGHASHRGPQPALTDPRKCRIVAWRAWPRLGDVSKNERPPGERRRAAVSGERRRLRSGARSIRQGRRARLPCLKGPTRPGRPILLPARSERPDNKMGLLVTWPLLNAHFAPARSWIRGAIFDGRCQMTAYELRPRRQPRRSDPALCAIHDALPVELLRHVYLLRVARPPPYWLREWASARPRD